MKKTTKKSAPTEKTENTERELKPHLFKSGAEWTGNKNGRPKGSRNKFGEQFIEDFMEDWKKHGKEALKRCRREDPAAYLRAATAILPKQLEVSVDKRELDKLLDSMNDQELDNLIRGLSAVGASGVRKEKTTETGTREKPNTVH